MTQQPGGPTDLSSWLPVALADRRLMLRLVLVLAPGVLAAVALVAYTTLAEHIAWTAYLGLVVGVVVLNGVTLAVLVGVAVRKYRSDVRQP